ncbi:MAG: trimeric intracellular cation channel family protein [Roseibium sp.]|uniref:trimeric intracellular cation channel family protein n=1 Tax=Roseibium sp. TaxID=1936156 RepID=UPI003D9C3960
MDGLDPLNPFINGINYFGDVVFSISGALTAGKYKMDLIGFILIGTITGIGGGTLRDIILGRQVFWTTDPTELILCVVVSFITFFFITAEILRRRGMVWGDTLGLAAFCVAGCHIALQMGVSWPVAMFMGMLTATGGGVIRDVITNTKPMILGGQLYATAALAGAGIYILLLHTSLPDGAAELIAFGSALAIRIAAIRFDIRMGPPGSFLTIGKNRDS